MDKVSNNYIISKFAIINKEGIITDSGLEKIFYPDDDGKYFKAIYKSLNIDYPKFYKMDRLCKLAFLTAEYLFKDEKVLEKYTPDEVAMVFSNSNSSLDTDIKHNASITDKEKYFPKPAVFVYTLPNILMGEISIRHTLRGEHIFFLSEIFDTRFMRDYTANLLNTSRHKACLLGWVDYLENGFESAIFFIEQGSDPGKKSLNRLSELYPIQM
jgi:hypothetical protein